MRSRALTTGIAVALTCTAGAEAANFKTLATIPMRLDGARPFGGFANVGGTLYGTTYGGGMNGGGSIFTVDPATGSETVVYSFPSTGLLANPGPALINFGGILYGVSDATLYSFNPATATATNLYTFPGTGLSHPYIWLTPVGSLLYGASCLGGSAGDGFLFSFDPSSNTVTTLYNFTGGFGGGSAEGSCPQGSLANVGGLLYGATLNGGFVNEGTMFSFNISTSTETPLYSFQNYTDGANPGDLVQLGGLVYGLVGEFSESLFSFDPASNALNILYTFPGTSCYNYASGLLPLNGLLYGSDVCGGSQTTAQLFSFNPSTAAISTVYAFPGAQASTPSGTLIPIGNTLYGSCSDGGPVLGQEGDLYSVNLATGTGTVLHSFVQSDGADDFTSTLLRVGKLYYGVSAFGGDNSRGALFSFDPVSHALNLLHTFDGADGSNPNGDLMYARGAIWGTTLTGGANNTGTIFSFNPSSGSETVAYSFGATAHDGANPKAALIEAGGPFYGTTARGGARGMGTMFEFHPESSTEHVVHSFVGHADGATPSGPLTAFGNLLYGTTQGGYKKQRGTLFSFDPASKREQVVFNFTGGGRYAPDGATPYAGVTALGGLLYGTTFSGGSHELGSVFSFNPATNAESVVYSFSYRGPKSSPGYRPEAPLTASGTKLFGSTFFGPRTYYGPGTIFSIDTASGTEKTYYHFSFDGTDGDGPTGGLVDRGGKFLGTTSRTAEGNAAGTIFSLEP